MSYKLNTNRSYQESVVDPLEFWSSENIKKFCQFYKVCDESYGVDQVIHEKYKWIQLNFDQQRDNKYAIINEDRKDRNTEVYHISQQDFFAMKDEIRWEYAWQIFDEVNDDLNP